MDDPALEPARHRRALAGLGRLNRVSGAAGTLWRALRDLAARSDGRPLRVLDVATGGGDIPIALWQRARRAGCDIRVTGCDVSPTAVARARDAAARRGASVDVVRLDALTDALPADHDVVTCSLFFHHLPDAQALVLLARLRDAARRRLLVGELERSRANLGLVALASRLVSRSDVVHTDALRSVRAAFTPPELAKLARCADLAGATVARCFPCRLLLRWDRP